MKVSQSCLLLLALSAVTDAFTPFAPNAASTVVGRLSLTRLQAEGTKITMPALSSTMKEGKVVTWLKSEGESIEAGEAIMVVESDKADMDVEAFEDGFLAKIIIGEGEMAPVGEAVALIAESQDEIASVIASFEGGAASAPAAPAAQAAPAAEGKLSQQDCVSLVFKILLSHKVLFCNNDPIFLRQLRLVVVRPTARLVKSICLPCPLP